MRSASSAGTPTRRKTNNNEKGNHRHETQSGTAGGLPHPRRVHLGHGFRCAGSLRRCDRCLHLQRPALVHRGRGAADHHRRFFPRERREEFSLPHPAQSRQPAAVDRWFLLRYGTRHRLQFPAGGACGGHGCGQGRLYHRAVCGACAAVRAVFQASCQPSHMDRRGAVRCRAVPSVHRGRLLPRSGRPADSGLLRLLRPAYSRH